MTAWNDIFLGVVQNLAQQQSFELPAHLTHFLLLGEIWVLRKLFKRQLAGLNPFYD